LRKHSTDDSGARRRGLVQSRLYLHGLAEEDFALSLRGLLGEEAPLSAQGSLLISTTPAYCSEGTSAIVRALASDSALVLADESTGNLDSRRGRAVLDLMREWVPTTSALHHRRV